MQETFYKVAYFLPSLLGVRTIEVLVHHNCTNEETATFIKRKTETNYKPRERIKLNGVYHYINKIYYNEKPLVKTKEENVFFLNPKFRGFNEFPERKFIKIENGNPIKIINNRSEESTFIDSLVVFQIPILISLLILVSQLIKASLYSIESIATAAVFVFISSCLYLAFIYFEKYQQKNWVVCVKVIFTALSKDIEVVKHPLKIEP